MNKTTLSVLAMLVFAANFHASAQDTPGDFVLTSFEGEKDMPPTMKARNCQAEIVKDNASDGQQALRIEMPPSEHDQGVTFVFQATADWSPYAALVGDIYLEGDKPFDKPLARVALPDKKHLYSGFRLQPGWNRAIVLFDLKSKDVGKQMTAIENLYIYGYNQGDKPLVMIIDNLRLRK